MGKEEWKIVKRRNKAQSGGLPVLSDILCTTKHPLLGAGLGRSKYQKSGGWDRSNARSNALIVTYPDHEALLES